ncbi:hypothetical protein SCORR_v1c09480 [Spiroplasma corruscae]|uniref:GIY-YIG domain-containing protein n=1 Tax=Spiroplasma corruscae TaxID=216934 RepID=A0A222EQD3_9MOLU|nr:GIY-YIG nuclease family protein [Spiroplasma corruscae]ASP28720.1 hypothetical protein SCORR_v1c09480 [Spiroplasma corruscae]
MQPTEKFKIVYDIKTKIINDYKLIEDIYMNKLVNYFKDTKIKIDISCIKKQRVILSGVYLMYCEIDNSIIFSYVGESIDLFKRFKQHIQGLNSNKKKYRIMSKLGATESNIKFLILSLEKDQSKRLFLETYYIYILRSKRYNMNTKLVSKRAKCSNNHGNMYSRLNNLQKAKFRLSIYIKCRNKLCKEVINISHNKELLYNRI